MAQINLETALQTINRAVTEHSSATDAQLEDYMMELINSNGEIIDKQPLSRLRDFVYNYLVTNKASDLADLVNSFNPIAFTEFPYLDSAAFFSRSTACGKQIEGNTATIKAFKGNTIAWNQLVQNGDFVDSSKWTLGNSTKMSLSISNNIATITNISGEEVSGETAGIRNTYVGVILSGHKYYVSLEYKASYDDAVCYINWCGLSTYKSLISSNTWYKVSGILTGTENPSRTSLFVRTNTAKPVPVGGNYQVKNVNLIDFTLMFGSGNEPSTAEEFEAMFPLDYYDYNAGGLLNNNMTHFVSSGTDASGFTFTDTLPIPVTQLTGKLNGAGESVTIFPDGLRSAGNAYDVIEKVDGQWYGVVNVGCVDMGTLNWSSETHSSSGNTRFYSAVPEKTYTDTVGRNSITSTRYVYNTAPIGYNTNYVDKTISGYTNDRIYLLDSSYTEAAALKAGLDGIMLNYQCTTKRYLLDTEFQSLLDTYRVANGGTEMILPVNNTSVLTTAPASFDFEYRVIDNEVKRICVQNWGGNYVDGEITKYEASQVTGIGNVFVGNTNITNFNELKYFTGLTWFRVSNSEGIFKNSSLEYVKFPDNAKNLGLALYDATKVKSVDLTNVTASDISLYYFVCSSKSTKSAISEVKLPGTTYTNIAYAFYNADLVSLIIDGTADFSKITSGNYARAFDYCTSFTTISGAITGIKYSISIPQSPLTRASALVLINGLDTVSTTQTITFSATTYALLTSDDIAIATGKGWTVASAS